MEWRIFTFNANDGDTTFEIWLARLANGVHAEQIQILNKTQVLLYFQSVYRDEFDDSGKQK